MLELLIWDALSGLLSDSDTLNNERQRRRSWSTTDDSVGDERRKLEAELKRLATQTDRFLDLYGDSTNDGESLDRKMEQVNAQRRATESEIRGLKNRSNEADRTPLAQKNLKRSAKPWVPVSKK